MLLQEISPRCHGYQIIIIIKIYRERYQMKILRYIFLLAVVFLCTQHYALKISADSLNGNTQLTANETKKIANDFVKGNFENLYNKGFKLVEVRELWGLDDTVIGYYYNVIEDGEIVGYVLASPNPRIQTVIEFGDLENGIDSYYGEKLSKNTHLNAYYLGVDEIYFNDSAKKLIDELESLRKEKVREASIYDKQLVNELSSVKFGLDYYTENINDGNKDATSSAIISASTRTTLPIRRLHQRASGIVHPNTSCGPTVGAMITNYYKDKRGFNVRDYTYYTNSSNLINHLYFDMNSSIWGTNAYSFGMGLQLHLNHDMSGWKIVSSANPTFNAVKTAIQNKYPVGAVWLVLSGENYHWRVINGFDQNGQYVSYVDPDGGSTNTGNHWVTWSSIQSKINTVYLSR